MNFNTRIITQNANNPETVYASVRLNRAQYLALREYVHTPDGEDVRFPYGTTLVKRGFGWYRLFATNGIRGIDKIKFAISVIKRCLREFEEKEENERNEAIRQLLPAVLEKTQPVAYTSNGFMYASKQCSPEPLKKPSLDKLLALQHKFTANHSK